MYPNQAQSTIGTLLRMIQEDQNKSIPSTTPASDPRSAIRGVVQGPLTSSEDTGSSHVVSVRPEGVTQTGQSVTPTTPTQGPSPLAGNVVAPLTPVTPAAPHQAAPAPAAQVASTLRAAAPAPAARPAPFATRIQPQIAITPQRRRIGVQIATNFKSRPSSFTA